MHVIHFLSSLGGGALDGAVVDAVDDVMGVLPVHGAADRMGGAEDLLHHAGKLPGHGSGPHDTGGSDDVVHGDVAVVLDVLHLNTKRQNS